MIICLLESGTLTGAVDRAGSNWAAETGGSIALVELVSEASDGWGGCRFGCMNGWMVCCWWFFVVAIVVL